jgi:hypothetical protein
VWRVGWIPDLGVAMDMTTRRERTGARLLYLAHLEASPTSHDPTLAVILIGYNQSVMDLQWAATLTPRAPLSSANPYVRKSRSGGTMTVDIAEIERRLWSAADHPRGVRRPSRGL